MGFDNAISVEVEVPAGRLQFEGQWGLLRLKNGRCVEGHLVGGKLLALKEMLVKGVPGWQGNIRAVHSGSGTDSRGYLEISEHIESTHAGSVLFVEFPDRSVRAYNLTRMQELVEGMRLHVAENPGYTITDKGIELLIYPQRLIKGRSVRCRLSGVRYKRTR